jgi:hypothetical protein
MTMSAVTLTEPVTVQAKLVLRAEGEVYRYRVVSESKGQSASDAERGTSQLVAFEWLTDLFGLSAGAARETLRMAEVFGQCVVIGREDGYRLGSA